MSDEIHVSTKDQPGDYDALETAKPDEPIFVVQGGDPLGPPTVQHWADLAREKAHVLIYAPRDMDPAEREKYEPSEAQRLEAAKLLRKATSAEQVAWEMKSYQRGDRAAPETRARYNEDVPLPDDGNDRAAVRKALISSVGQLNNALGIATVVREVVAAMNLHPDECAMIAQGVEMLKRASDGIEPRRAGERS